MRQIKITVTVQQDGQIRKYADTEYRYQIDVEGELSEKKVFRFCRECLNNSGVDYQNWSERLNDSIDKNGNMEQVKSISYFNGYFTFDKISEEKDYRGIATKASYAYKVVIPYCD